MKGVAAVARWRASSPREPASAALKSLMQLRQEIEHRRDDDVDRYELDAPKPIGNGAWFSFSTALMVRCSGVICKPAAQCFRQAHRSTICLNSSCKWTANSSSCGSRVTPISRPEE